MPSYICLTWRNVAGDQLLLPNEMDTDLEQLIKGGPFELSLAADRLGNDLFGINSGAQVRLTLTLTLPCACMLVPMTEREANPPLGKPGERDM